MIPIEKEDKNNGENTSLEIEEFIKITETSEVYKESIINPKAEESNIIREY